MKFINEVLNILLLEIVYCWCDSISSCVIVIIGFGINYLLLYFNV